MALTRKMLKGMGLTEEQVDTIVEAHTETVDGLKDRLSAAEDKAKRADDLQKELDGLKPKDGEDYKTKAERLEKELADYKAQVAAKETKTAKEAAAKAYFEAKNITGNNLAIALRGARDEISGIELDSSGGIKDTKALDALVSGEFSGLVVKTASRGAKTATPPGSSDGNHAKTKAEILAIKDTSERQAAWADYIAAQQSPK